MNEEHQNEQSTPTEKSSLDEKRKTALLRYITILFAVAFLFVLFSMLQQSRDSRAAISELNQSSASALQKAEQLQDTNRQLQEDNEALQTQVEALTAQVEALEQELADQPVLDDDIAGAIMRLQQEVQTAKGKTQEAYELLLQAMELYTPGSQEGNVAFSKAMDNLENLKDYLGEAGLEEYNRLLEKGE
ncbi:MAG: hypothetical protein ACI4PT_04985 [Candidatus Avoscillospira sp.]